MRYLIILLLVLTFPSCNDSSDKIIGNWERINDEQKGMIITVVKEKDNYVGKISYVSEENNNKFWAIDDVKWKEIEYVSTGNYKFQDLFKSWENNEITEIGYSEGYLELNNNNKLIIKHTKDNLPGVRQEWIRK
jgi:hypothetical protein